ncbi:hypothetical protein BG844_16545 [Couchioplanes caeruleus subsp. caeruleus]|uniref:ABC3 transporter permease C-terminal domain-containing protein n=2 Tax=Couchioplanes caeruleus TaxID=56438 RepID=A0A1K0FK53_9ACTN|nr:hypothetical protein BG844_16545 [Couchioplanes caeruleus subsp. caeruleus]
MLSRPGRLVMTGLSVLIAAFVVFAAVLAQQIAVRTTLERFSGTSPAADFVVTAEEEPLITQAEADAVRRVPGVGAVAPRLNNGLPVAGGGLTEHFLRLDGDPGTGALSRVRVVSGSYPDGLREVAVDRLAAAQLNVAPGGIVNLRLPEDRGGHRRSVAVTVTAIVQGPTGEAATGYAPAHLVAGIVGVRGYQRLDVQAAPGAADAALSARLSAALPRTGGVSVVPGDLVRDREARERVRDLDELFRAVAMFLAVAVVAAALVATSAFRIVFTQRLRQLALLRTIGAQRSQLVRALAAEGALTGLGAGTAGVLLALGAGYAAPAVAGVFGAQLPAPVPPVVAALAVVAGAVVVTMGAVLAPALSAAGVAPLQALRTAGTMAAERRIGVLRLLAGMLFAAGAAAIVGMVVDQIPAPGDQQYDSFPALMLIVVSGALAFLALIALGPLLVRPALAVAGRALRRFGPLGRLAVGGVGGTPRRAAAVSAVVALGVTLVAGTMVAIAGLQGWAARGMAVRAPADLHLRGGDSGVPPEVVRHLRALPHLRDVTTYRRADVTMGRFAASAIDLDLAALPRLKDLYAATGDLADLGPGRVVVNDELASTLEVRAGDALDVGGGRRSVRLTVAATLSGDAPLNADIIAVPADLDRLGVAAASLAVLADSADDSATGRTAARAAVERAAGGLAGADLQVLADQRDGDGETLELISTIALSLLGLTVLIAVVGVGTTTGLSVQERTHEFGLLRALGLGRARLRLMIGMEAGLYGVLGGILGLLLGVPYAWLTVRALNLGAPLVFPAGRLTAVVAALAAATALAGLLPARRATRVSPVQALGTPD